MSSNALRQEELNLYKKKVGRYVLKFNTDKQSVSADVLGRALLSYQDTIRQVVKNCDGVVDALLEVDVIRTGCVEVGFSMTSRQATDDDSKQAEIVGNVRALTDLYRFLQGKTIKKCDDGGEDELIVTNMDGGTMHVNRRVFAAYHDSTYAPFGDASAYAADEISSVQLLDGEGKEQIRIDKPDFSAFVKPTLRITDIQKADSVEERNLTIVMVPLLAPRNKWVFAMSGERICASIVDETFLAKMAAKTESFAQGDVIRARVRINREYDNIAKVYKVTSYMVEKVVEHIHNQKLVEEDDALMGKESGVEGETT